MITIKKNLTDLWNLVNSHEEFWRISRFCILELNFKTFSKLNGMELFLEDNDIQSRRAKIIRIFYISHMHIKTVEFIKGYLLIRYTHM